MSAPSLPRLHFVIDGPPEHNAGRFVEVEDDLGRSINAGDWKAREGGTWALPVPRVTPEAEALLQAAIACGEAYWGRDKQRTDHDLLQAALAFEKAARLQRRQK